MKNSVYISLMLFLSGAISCTKDKGSYTYTTEPDAITISSEMRQNPINPTLPPFSFEYGEPIEIPAKYTVNDAAMTDVDLTFEWSLGDEIVGTGPVLRLDPLPIAGYTGMLTITEHRYGMKYNDYFMFDVEPKYTSGWAVLTDDGMQSHLNYMTMDSNTGEFVWEEDVYALENSGATLATGSGPLVYHPYQDAVSYALTVIQPGAEGPIDLNAHDMLVNGKIKENFVGNVPSADFKDIVWKMNSQSVCALTDDGKLYLRDEAIYEGAGGTAIVPFSGKFSAPLVMEGGEYSVSHIINTSLLSGTLNLADFAICYDEINNRCMFIIGTQVFPFTDAIYTNGSAERFMPGDAGWNGMESQDDILFPGPENLNDYNVVKMIGCGFDAYLWSGYMTVVMILEGKAQLGEYYLLAFDYYANGTNPDVDLSFFCKWPDDAPIDPDTMLINSFLGGPSRFYFTTEGNRDLYYFDVDFNGIGKYGPVYNSDVELCSFGKGAAQGAFMPGIYQDMLVLGDVNGGVKIIQINDTVLASGNAEVIASFSSNSGNVSCIEFMPNNWSDF